MCETSGLAPLEVFGRLREAGLGSTPGTAAEVLHDGVRERISPNKLPVARWVEIIEASHGVGLRSTVTVMFGHIEEPWELAEHMRVVREVQAAHRRLHRVRAALLRPLSHAARAHARDRGDLARGEPQAHGRLPAGPGARVSNLQASWVKMGLDAATEALRWGVNDLGGTLMEESISRAWRAPSTVCRLAPRGADRRRPRGRAPGG